MTWQNRPDVQRVQRRTVTLLIVAQVLGGVGIGAGASMGAILAEQVTGSESLAGVARTATTVGAAVAAVPLAGAAIRWGRGRSLGSGWLTAALGGALLVLAAGTQQTALLIVGMFLFGFGTATNMQSRFAATDLAAPQRAARLLSLVVWSSTVGTVLGPNLGGPGRRLAAVFGLDPLAGSFLISTVLAGLSALVMFALRPDPLLLARSHTHRPGANPPPRRGMREALGVIWAHPDARFAFVAIALGHAAMAAVMTMTPVHMHHHHASLELVGLTISVHVLGMFALSPVVGWLADRWGRRRVVVLGQAILLAAAACAGLGARSMGWVTAGLFLLGLGWSCAVVAGSALLSESVDADHRTAAQGVSDTAMNAAAALAAATSGPVQMALGFSGLNVIAAALTVPVLGLALAHRRR